MKNVKINLDRPPVDSKEIQASKNFDSLMKNHQMMSKPFYKSPWFIGTTGLASISIIVGGVISFNSSEDQVSQDVTLDNQAPPELTTPDNNLIALNSDITPKTATDNLVKDTFKYSEYIENQIDDNNNTLEESNPNEELVIQEENDNTTEEVESVSHQDKHEQVKDDVDKNEDFSALMPRIGGKINGSISRDELFDNKGITTESDVSIIHFELHLIDGLGGKVFEEESNQLNDEMKAALKMINQGETIYFENIKAKTEDGVIVRLNPLRYVLMN